MQRSALRLLFSTAVLLLLAVPVARACSCMAPPPPRDALTASDFVFAGKVDKIQRTESEGWARFKVTFVLDHSYKGLSDRRFVLYTADNSAACGYHFEKGQHYLVYGSTYDGEHQTNICTRTNALDNAQEDLEALDGLGNAVKGPRCGGLDNFAALQAIAFIFLGLTFFRRRNTPIQPEAHQSSL